MVRTLLVAVSITHIPVNQYDVLSSFSVCSDRCLLQAEKLQTMPVEERMAKAKAVSSSRVLTQDDFKKIRLAQMAKELTGAPGKAQKRKIEDIDDEEDNR